MYSALTARHTFASCSELGPVATCGRAAHTGQRRSPESAAARPLPSAVAPALAPRSPRPRLLVPAVAPALAMPSARSRLSPPAVALALVPRSPRPRLSLPAVAHVFAPRSLQPRVSRCRRLGLGDVFDQAGLMEQEVATVGVDAWASDSATREALGWWRGGGTRRRAARLCVVRRRVLAAGKGRLCAPRKT